MAVHGDRFRIVGNATGYDYSFSPFTANCFFDWQTGFFQREKPFSSAIRLQSIGNVPLYPSD